MKPQRTQRYREMRIAGKRLAHRFTWIGKIVTDYRKQRINHKGTKIQRLQIKDLRG